MSPCPAKALERQIHQEMLIKTLAYEKMNDLKHDLNKSSQKWPRQVNHHDETPFGRKCDATQLGIW